MMCLKYVVVQNLNLLLLLLLVYIISLFSWWLLLFFLLIIICCRSLQLFIFSSAAEHDELITTGLKTQARIRRRAPQPTQVTRSSPSLPGAGNPCAFIFLYPC